MLKWAKAEAGKLVKVGCGFREKESPRKSTKTMARPSAATKNSLTTKKKKNSEKI